jgi:multidrug efflux pump subunit AcrB
MKKLVEYFVKYPIWANAIIFTMVIFGALSYGWVMKRSFFPETDPTTISVGVVMPGASPQEMEEGVTIKIEESLKGLEGIKEITSTSSENNASIIVQLERGIDADEALAEVKNAVDRINSFPTNAERPLVFKVKPRSRTMYLGLRAKEGKDLDLFLLKKYAEQIEDEMLASGVISQLNISGYPDIEISLEVPEATLLRYGLRFEQIAAAVRLNNRDISAGAIKSKEEEILIRSRAKEKMAEKIGNIVLRATTDGSNLRLRDIATIKEQFADVPNALHINGERAVSLEITKLKE